MKKLTSLNAIKSTYALIKLLYSINCLLKDLTLIVAELNQPISALFKSHNPLAPARLSSSLLVNNIFCRLTLLALASETTDFYWEGGFHLPPPKRFTSGEAQNGSKLMPLHTHKI